MEGEGTRRDLAFGTIPGALAAAAERFGEAIFLEDGAVSLSFAATAARVREATRALMAAGIEPGDRVAIWAPNLWEWVVAALATHEAGGVLVPINTRYRGAEAAWILQRSRARLLFTVTDFLDTDYVALLRGADAALPGLDTVVVLRGHAPGGTVAWSDFLARAVEVTADAARARVAALAPDALADILFTSGTTGRPKGAMCTHAQDLRAFGDWADVVGLRHGDRYLVVAPFFHAFGYKAGWLACLLTGATVLPQPVFDVDAVLARIPRDRVSVLPGPPALYQTFLLREDLADHDLSSLRLAVTGAATIPVRLIEQMRDVLAFETVITGYGLTEATGIATMCRYDDAPETIARTSGRAIPGVEVRVLDAEGEEVARGEPGEIVVRGYNVMQGYLDDPEATGQAVDRDGWLHTGDIGVMDDRGYVRITDRLKDMFIVGGFNAYPAEIEHALLDHPDVGEVAVIGVPDPRLGEAGMAFVVLRAGHSLTEGSLIAWAREHMANFKVPKRVAFVDSLPRNASGKVTKFILREQAGGA